MDQNTENKNGNFKNENEFELRRKMNSGLSWFYWIAGLSIINSVLFFTNMNVSFVAGLGITQFVDGILKEYPNVSYIGLIINAFFILGFIMLGRFGKNSKALIIIGIIIYSFDTLIFIFIKDWLSIGFHIFAVVGLISGLLAKIKLDMLPKNEPASMTEPVKTANELRLEQLMAGKETPADDKNP